MNWLKFFIRRQLYEDLEQEIASHLEQRIEELVASGISVQEAAATARREFGNVELAKETAREAWGWRWLEDLFADLRLAVRMLRKNASFTAITVVTLALGIGANTAIFSLTDAALLRSLPVRDPERLVVFQWSAHRSPNTKGQYGYMACPAEEAAGAHGCSFSYPMFRKFQALTGEFSSVAALGGDVGLNLRGNGPTSFAHGELVSGSFFATLGVAAARGRMLSPSDDMPGAPAVAVLSYGYWQSVFGGDSATVGKIIRLNNIPVTIVGVAAREFPSLDPARAGQMWLPLSLQPQLGKNLNGTLGGDRPSLQAGDDNWWVYVVARPRPGIMLSNAEASASAIFHNQVLDQAKDLFRGEDQPRLLLTPASEAIRGLRERFSMPLAILMAAVGLVLLLTCANVAGLTLARFAARQRELGVRQALGAGRARIARQVLTESVLLSIAGGIAGILWAYWSLPLLVAFMSRGGLWPSHLAVRLDPRVLCFATAVSIFAGIASGLAPALRSMSLDLTPSLQPRSASSADVPPRERWLNLGNILVIAQVALSVLVLAGAGLLARTLRNLERIGPGFDTRNILIFGIDPTLNGYTELQSQNLYAQLQKRLETLPGILSATYSFDPLLSGNVWTSSFYIEGEPQRPEHVTDALAIGPEFFETMQIPFLAGRTFSSRDFTPSTFGGGAVIINETFARTFFKDRNPLGQSLADLGGKDATYEIAGIVGDAKYQSLRSEIAPTAYVPQKSGDTTFEVRTAGDPRTLIPAVRTIVSQLDNNLPLSNLSTQSEQIDRSLFQERLIARVSSFFGGISLLLACVGLYGLLSFQVTRSTVEIGIRMALGARCPDILRAVVARGARLCLAGAFLGIFMALGATRYLASLLYGVRPSDPLTFALVGILLGVVALVASYIPARRAARVDPMVALRRE